MATIRLVPSTYSLSNTSYLSVSNASNMYHNTDNSSYAKVTNSQNGTTSYYIYVKGFNWSDIPEGAVINSWTVKLKAKESGGNTSSSYAPKLSNGTSQITSTCSALSTTATVHEFTGVGCDFDTAKGYGSEFGVRINCRRQNSACTSFNSTIRIKKLLQSLHILIVKIDIRVNFNSSHLYFFLLRLLSFKTKLVRMGFRTSQ